MRLIDADEILGLFVESGQKHGREHGVKLGENWLLDYNDIKAVIDNAPTIEKRPKGKWIEHVDEKWGGVWYTCSNCCQYALYERDVYNIWRQKLSDFCPKCGADMRGE